MEGELRAECATEPVAVSLLVLALDLRLLRNTFLIFLLAAATEPEPDVSESVLSEELESSEDDEEFMTSAKTPGCDSSSMIA